MLTKPQLTTMLETINQVRIWHWQTTSHAAHLAFAELYEKLTELMDDWIETDLGAINGRLEVLPVKLSVENIGKLPEVMEELRLYREFLKQNLPAAVEPTDTHLLNIRDEMLAAVDRCLYRLSQD